MEISQRNNFDKIPLKIDGRIFDKIPLKIDGRILDKIPLKIDGRILFVPIETIYWLESSGNYVEVVVGQHGDKLLVRDTLSSFEGRLDRRFFVRIHRSIIVNVTRIREMRPHHTGEYQVTMDNGRQLTLSRGYRFNLKRLVQAYS